MEKGNKDKLFEVADRQQGYFTARQAQECGYSRSNFFRFLESGEWIREIRGVYRLGRYPIQDRPELVLWTLWSRNKRGEPQGVWSHETALDIYDLSDVMPSKMHMMVPRYFRRHAEIPKVLRLHYGDLEKADVKERWGYKVTTPLRTLIDIIEAKTVADNFIVQAVSEALNRGLVLEDELTSLEESHPDVYAKITRLFDV